MHFYIPSDLSRRRGKGIHNRNSPQDKLDSTQRDAVIADALDTVIRALENEQLMTRYRDEQRAKEVNPYWKFQTATHVYR